MADVVCIYDSESTGKNEEEHRLIEVTCRLHRLSTGAHIDTKTWRSNPLRRIDPGAAKVHGIKAEDLKNEPTFDLVAPKIAKIFSITDLLVAHNGDFFDFPFLKRDMERVGVKCEFPKTFDTMVRARWATHNGKIPTLGELARCLDVPYDPALAHSAEYDTDVLAKCFFEGIRIGAFVV